MRAFDHILIVMFENEFRGTVMRNEFMRDLAAQGRDLSTRVRVGRVQMRSPGWGPSESLPRDTEVGSVPLAAAASSREIWLLYKARDSDSLQLMRGSWRGAAVEEERT